MTDNRLAALRGQALTSSNLPSLRLAAARVQAITTTASGVTNRLAALRVQALTRTLLQPDTRIAAFRAQVLTATRPVYETEANRAGGRVREGVGTATWEPDVAPLPAGLELGAHVVSAQAIGPVTIGGARPLYEVDHAELPAHRDRIVVGGVDVTYFRGAPTPFPGFGLTEPLMYGPTALTFPQVAACFEEPGVGALSWCKLGKAVKIQRVDATTGEVVATDYRGVVVGYDTSGAELRVSVGGEATGRAALRNKQIPLVAFRHDIGRYAWRAIEQLGLRFQPRLGPTTGIKLHRLGGMGHLEYLTELCARAWTRDGTQWTIMPGADGVYRMQRKDRTTIDGVAYCDDASVVASLARDASEEPNRVFATGVTPEGKLVRFGAYPGLKQTDPAPYPFDDHRDFGVGTTNGATDTGDGITVMLQHLMVMKYLDVEDMPGGYDNRAARAIEDLQADADLPETGTMTWETWRALYDLSATGFSLRWSRILPAAEKPAVRRFRRSASGAVIGRNPNHDPHRLVVDHNVDFGSGHTHAEMREWARAEVAESQDAWVGTLTFHTGALLVGTYPDPTGTPTVTPADVLRARDLRPGMNLSLPRFAGGITVHVSAVKVGQDGTVSCDVDTRARDAMKVWEVIARNRESRQSPARIWRREYRSSKVTKDSIGVWDQVAGVLGDDIPCEAQRWTVFPVVAGQEGTVRSLRIRTNPDAEYVVAVFGKRIGRGQLRSLVGNPLTKPGTKAWAKETVRDQLEDHFLLYVAGDYENPCGYFPKAKEGENDDGESGGPPLTGRWEDDAGFSYHTFEQPVLYVAVFPDRDTVIPAGRIMWNQLEAGV